MRVKKEIGFRINLAKMRQTVEAQMSQLEARMGQVEIQTGILDGIKSRLG